MALATGVLSGLLRGATAPVPSLSLGAVSPVPVVAVIALVPAIAVTWGWSGLGWEATAAAARSTWLLVAPLLVTNLAAFALGSWLVGGSGSLLESGRNACGLLGLALLGCLALGERGAVAVPTGYLLAAFLLGRGSGRSEPWWWAWVLSDGGSVVAGGSAIALLLGGVLVLPRIPVAVLRRGER
ncbi:MAG: hypothetical protein J7518_06050 [Nocardioidaceae bacterium]|nr:hypothetical protein [Nocardioidaceae bacterium]